MYIVFYSTSLVFEAEERLNKNGIDCKVVPTPVTDKAYCGVCIETPVLDKYLEIENEADALRAEIRELREQLDDATE